MLTVSLVICFAFTFRKLNGNRTTHDSNINIKTVSEVYAASIFRVKWTGSEKTA